MKTFDFRLFRPLLPLFALALAVGACKSNDGHEAKASDTPHRAMTKPNNSWIALTGTVTTTGPHAFVLDYGPGNITVEMDDWDWFPEGQALMKNDEVIVYGYVDDDFYEKRTIEASSVYVKGLGTQFYASGMDEEDFPVTVVIPTDRTVRLTGTVKKVSGNEFVLDTGAATVDVNVSPMPYDPLDKEGFHRVKPGDRVQVSGELGYDFFNDLDFMADSVVTLQRSS